MVAVKFRYVYEDHDRHGNVRLYFWRGRGQPKFRILEELGSEAFSVRYHELLRPAEAGGQPVAQESSPQRPRHGTFRWLCAQYFSSTAFRALDPETQRVRQRILEACCREPVRPDSEERYAEFPLPRVTTKALRVLRDRKFEAPEAANSRVKAIRGLFKWAKEDDRIATNPALELSRVKNTTEGFHTWTAEEVAQFEECHPIGSKGRLALGLMLYTGLRKSDAVLLGRQHVKDGWISKRQYKNRNRHPVQIQIPVLAPLAEILAASPAGTLNFLVTQWGRPFSIKGFGNWFRDRCDEAGLPQCSSHGLRKAGATLAAEQGATTQQLMAIFGWKNVAETEVYTKKAEQRGWLVRA